MLPGVRTSRGPVVLILVSAVLAAGDPELTDRMLAFQDELRAVATAKGANVRGS